MESTIERKYLNAIDLLRDLIHGGVGDMYETLVEAVGADGEYELKDFDEMLNLLESALEAFYAVK